MDLRKAINSIEHSPLEIVQAKFYIDENVSKRKEIKNLIKELKKNNNNIDHNIFKSLDNVNLNCVLGVKKDKQYKSFLEDYDKRS